LYFTTLQLF
jgi:hypothetical protein